MGKRKIPKLVGPIYNTRTRIKFLMTLLFLLTVITFFLTLWNVDYHYLLIADGYNSYASISAFFELATDVNTSTRGASLTSNRNVTYPQITSSSFLYNSDTRVNIAAGTKKLNSKPCALLFFGLIKSFDVALPAIQQNIINENPFCDIYVHTYNLTKMPVNARNNEFNQRPLCPNDAFKLSQHAVIESMENFYQKREAFLNRTRPYSHKRFWGPCCVSHDNMIKQWHSIEGAWNLMRQHEKTIVKRTVASKSTTSVANHESTDLYYEQFGFFRLDVYFVNKVNIFDSNASLPSWGRYRGFNDRLFYGNRKTAEVWAHRFDFADDFEKRYLKKWPAIPDGYHSEYYLHSLFHHHNISVQEKPICVWRIRSNKSLSIKDCRELSQFSNITELLRSAPPGYMVQDKKSAILWAEDWEDAGENNTITQYHNVGSHSLNNTVNDHLFGKLNTIFVLGSFKTLMSENDSSMASTTYNLDSYNSILSAIINQNNAFLLDQRMLWNSPNIGSYNASQSLANIKGRHVPTTCGNFVLKVLNHVNKTLLHIVSDPRLTVTLKAWTPFMSPKPAIIISISNPITTALKLTLMTGSSFEQNLHIWLEYTKRSFINAQGLCTVISWNDASIVGHLEDFERVKNELQFKCGMSELLLKRQSNFLRSILYEVDDQLSHKLNSEILQSSMFNTVMGIYNILRIENATSDDFVWPESVLPKRSIVDENHNISHLYTNLKLNYRHCITYVK